MNRARVDKCCGIWESDGRLLLVHVTFLLRPIVFLWSVLSEMPSTKSYRSAVWFTTYPMKQQRRKVHMQSHIITAPLSALLVMLRAEAQTGSS